MSLLKQRRLTGLALLACYTAVLFLLFIFVLRLDMARNAPVMNFEPVASLLLGYIAGQMLTPSQLVGGAVVVGGIVVLSLSKA